MTLTVRDVMQSPVHVVDPGLRLPELEREFLSHRVTGFPVVRDGLLVGVVSRSDIVRTLSVEHSRAGQLSDYYRDLSAEDPDQERCSLEAEAAEVGVRLADQRVRDVMCTSVISVPPSTSVAAAAREMVEQRIHRVPVVEADRVVGLLTSIDLLRLIADGRLARPQPSSRTSPETHT